MLFTTSIMSELKSIFLEEAINKKLAVIILCQCILSAISLFYCIITFYHQNFKGLICLVGSLAVTSVTYISARYQTSFFGLFFVITLVVFVFQHVMTRKWAYLVNDHDIVNDWSY